MSVRKIIAAIVLADFAALNAYALYTEGFGGFVTYLQNMGPWGWVLGVDLVIALGMVLVWVWHDAKENDRNALPYTLLTIATGSIGTLLYYLTGRNARTA